MATPEELMEMFHHFDKNGVGKISVSEFRSVIEAFSPTMAKDELDKMMELIDIDGDGYIDKDEFVKCMNVDDDASGSQSQWRCDLRDAFEIYDADGDGKISASELHAVLTRLRNNVTVEDCRRMIGAFDSDGDGYVDFEEFEKMMNA